MYYIILSAPEERWNEAQHAEITFWNTHERPTTEFWKELLHIGFGIEFSFFREKDVLEVGCGPSGLIYSLDETKSRIGIEPMDITKILGVEEWKKKMVRRGVGEDIPCSTESVDIIILFNVLDHCRDPLTVIRECYRVLRKDGILLIWIHTLRGQYRFLRPILNKVDKPHPHHFTFNKIKGLIEDGNFKIQAHKYIKGAGIHGHEKSNGNVKLILANLMITNVFWIARKTSI